MTSLSNTSTRLCIIASLVHSFQPWRCLVTAHAVPAPFSMQSEIMKCKQIQYSTYFQTSKYRLNYLGSMMNNGGTAYPKGGIIYRTTSPHNPVTPPPTLPRSFEYHIKLSRVIRAPNISFFGPHLYLIRHLLLGADLKL